MSHQLIKTSKMKLVLAFIWFLFTFSLVFWWWIFSLRQLTYLNEVLESSKFQSLKNMLVWEGAVLVIAVFCGGAVLIVLTWREQSRIQRLQKFFSNFAHDLKTSITRLRLRVEVISEFSSNPELQKLIDDVNRLDLQLENSLWVARNKDYRLTFEKIKLSAIIGSLRAEWPELEIKLHQEAILLADTFALKSIFRNIIQNSIFHGKSTLIELVPAFKESIYSIKIIDNGVGYQGKISELGSQPLKANNEKSNGIGLYLTQDLINRMNGSIKFSNHEHGFSVEIILPAYRKDENSHD